LESVHCDVDANTEHREMSSENAEVCRSMVRGHGFEMVET